MPFLVLRPDAGQFTYQRSVPAEIASLVSGDIELIWDRGQRKLSGKPLVKISLQTGDDAMARVRWAQIHPQVEALVQIARLRANSAAAPKQSATEVDRLTRDQISTMSAQVHHDILAEHDQGWIDPTFSSPLTAIITKVMLAQGAAMNQQTIDDARGRAQTILDRRSKQALMARDIRDVDRRIEEAELDLDPIVFDLDALRSGRTRQLSDAQMAAIHKAESGSMSTIPSDLDNILAENGLDLADDHPDRRRLALEVLRAQVKANAIIKERERGAPIDTPERPPVLKQAVPLETVVETLSALRLRWIKLNRPSPKQIDDNALYVGSFIEVFGDLPVNQVTRKQMIAFRDKLLDRPRNVPKSIAKTSLTEQIAWAATTKAPRLSRGTINAKGIGAISTLMRIAIDDELITINPCAGTRLKLNDRDVVDREPFSLVELQAIFKSGIYQVPARISKAGGGVTAYWLPLLALFTGARLEELGQLLVADIKVVDGITYFDITDIPDDDESDSPDNLTEVETAKTLKTLSARRQVPMHAVLIRCGFLDFVRDRRQSGHVRLFPDLKAYRSRCTRNWSKFWGRYCDTHITKSKAKTFHSFRHGVIRRLRNLEVNESIIKAIVGHVLKDTTSKYGRVKGKLFELRTLDDSIQKLDYPGLDIGPIIEQQSWRHL